MTTLFDRWHGPRIWHAHAIASLESAQEEPSLDTGLTCQGRCRDLTMEPDEWLILW